VFVFKTFLAIQTGQGIRYLQTFENGKKTVQYLHNNERGILNFVASTTTIRNNQIVEEAFDVQQDRVQDEQRYFPYIMMCFLRQFLVLRAISLRSKKKVVGHQVALQVAGYNWLPHVQADELGVKYVDIDAIYGRPNALKILSLNSANDRSFWKLRNALKLVSEVVPNNGGRMLLLRSVFKVVNKTNHSLHLLANFTSDLKKGFAEESDDVPFTIPPGEAFYIPLALLHKSATLPSTKRLGSLWIRPSDLTPVKESMETDFSHLMVERIEYSMTPIDLHDIVEESAALLQASVLAFRPDGSLVNSGDAMTGKQMCCFIQARPKRNRKGTASNEIMKNTSPINSGVANNSMLETYLTNTTTNRLPPFCYNVDVRRIEPSLAKLWSAKKENNAEKISKITKFALNRLGRLVSAGAAGQSWKDDTHPPLHYSIGLNLNFIVIKL